MSSAVESKSEPELVRARYARRPAADARYSLLNQASLLSLQERQRAMVGLLGVAGLHELSELKLVEVGSGDGGNLLEFLRFGFNPSHLCGIELLDERHRAAAGRLPGAVQLLHGDAAAARMEPASWDIVFASTLFSSLLDDAFQERLAAQMWAWLRPNGAILWYDFIYNNPRNPDVRGVPVSRIRKLFPKGSIISRRVTLAPPIARPAVRMHPGMYPLLNTMPWLRTHVLCWIKKTHD